MSILNILLATNNNTGRQLTFIVPQHSIINHPKWAFDKTGVFNPSNKDDMSLLHKMIPISGINEQSTDEKLVVTGSPALVGIDHPRCGFTSHPAGPQFAEGTPIHISEEA